MTTFRSRAPAFARLCLGFILVSTPRQVNAFGAQSSLFQAQSVYARQMYARYTSVQHCSGCWHSRHYPSRQQSCERWSYFVKRNKSGRRRDRLGMSPDDIAPKEGGFLAEPIQDLLPEAVQEELSIINNDPAKLAFVLNALVVFMFGAFAAYKLATVDVDISRGWTWYEILLRVPGDNFYRYEATVSENPIITKALTSCVAYGLGDLTAQIFMGRNLETMDLTRTARSATAGLLIHGPLCHFWIMLMQTYLDFEGAWWNFIPKVIADQTVWSIFLNAAYSTMIMALQGMSPAKVWEEVKSTAWPALTSSWRFWPLIHCISFSTFIPTDLKLLFIDCMEIIWVTILSTVANKDRKGDLEGSAMQDDIGKPSSTEIAVSAGEAAFAAVEGEPDAEHNKVLLEREPINQ